MALQIQFHDVTSLKPVSEAYVRLTLLAVDGANKVARFVFLVYRSKADADGGAQPIGNFEFPVAKHEQPERPAQVSAKGAVLQPAIPRMPGYDEFFSGLGVTGADDLLDAFKAVVYEFFKGRPEFEGSVDV